MQNNVAVVSKERTMFFDKDMTLREVIDKAESLGEKISLRRTLRLYGLKFGEERSFVSRYRQEFNLSKTKTMYDIKLKELVLYRDLLIGSPYSRG